MYCTLDPMYCMYMYTTNVRVYTYHTYVPVRRVQYKYIPGIRSNKLTSAPLGLGACMHAHMYVHMYISVSACALLSIGSLVEGTTMSEIDLALGLECLDSPHFYVVRHQL